jgi:pilus assembly protein TadC
MDTVLGVIIVILMLLVPIAFMHLVDAWILWRMSKIEREVFERKRDQ